MSNSSAVAIGSAPYCSSGVAYHSVAQARQRPLRLTPGAAASHPMWVCHAAAANASQPPPSPCGPSPRRMHSPVMTRTLGSGRMVLARFFRDEQNTGHAAAPPPAAKDQPPPPAQPAPPQGADVAGATALPWAQALQAAAAEAAPAAEGASPGSLPFVSTTRTYLNHHHHEQRPPPLPPQSTSQQQQQTPDREDEQEEGVEEEEMEEEAREEADRRPTAAAEGAADEEGEERGEEEAVRRHGRLDPLLASVEQQAASHHPDLVVDELVAAASVPYGAFDGLDVSGGAAAAMRGGAGTAAGRPSGGGGPFAGMEVEDVDRVSGGYTVSRPAVDPAYDDVGRDIRADKTYLADGSAGGGADATMLGGGGRLGGALAAEAAARKGATAEDIRQRLLDTAPELQEVYGAFGGGGPSGAAGDDEEILEDMLENGAFGFDGAVVAPAEADPDAELPRGALPDPLGATHGSAGGGLEESLAALDALAHLAALERMEGGAAPRARTRGGRPPGSRAAAPAAAPRAPRDVVPSPAHPEERAELVEGSTAGGGAIITGEAPRATSGVRRRGPIVLRHGAFPRGRVTLAAVRARPAPPGPGTPPTPAVPSFFTTSPDVAEEDLHPPAASRGHPPAPPQPHAAGPTTAATAATGRGAGRPASPMYGNSPDVTEEDLERSRLAAAISVAFAGAPPGAPGQEHFIGAPAVGGQHEHADDLREAVRARVAARAAPGGPQLPRPAALARRYPYARGGGGSGTPSLHTQTIGVHGGDAFGGGVGSPAPASGGGGAAAKSAYDSGDSPAPAMRLDSVPSQTYGIARTAAVLMAHGQLPLLARPTAPSLQRVRTAIGLLHMTPEDSVRTSRAIRARSAAAASRKAAAAAAATPAAVQADGAAGAAAPFAAAPAAAHPALAGEGYDSAAAAAGAAAGVAAALGSREMELEAAARGAAAWLHKQYCSPTAPAAPGGMGLVSALEPSGGEVSEPQASMGGLSPAALPVQEQALAERAPGLMLGMTEINPADVEAEPQFYMETDWGEAHDTVAPRGLSDECNVPGGVGCYEDFDEVMGQIQDSQRSGFSEDAVNGMFESEVY